MVLKIIGFFIAFGSILFLVVVITKFIGNKAQNTMRGHYISIVESINIGLDKQLHLVKVGDQFVLIASAGKSIEFLSTVNLEGYETQAASQPGNVFDFKSFFEKYLQNFKKSSTAGAKTNTVAFSEPAEGDVFKSNLEKLRSINKKVGIQGMENGDENSGEK